jgi:hypothetical protein
VRSSVLGRVEAGLSLAQESRGRLTAERFHGDMTAAETPSPSLARNQSNARYGSRVSLSRLVIGAWIPATTIQAT